MDGKVSLGAVVLASIVCWVLGIVFAFFAYQHVRITSAFWSFMFFGAACALTLLVLRAFRQPAKSESDRK
jgi:hypothetical protein